MANFETAIELVLEHEGGYVNHSADRGGATNWGITEETLSRWRGQDADEDAVRTLTKEEAKKIYRKEYWDPMSLNWVDHQLCAELLFDQGVNCGVKTAALRAQGVINDFLASAGKPKILEDGHFGPKSAKALNSLDPRLFALEFIKETQIAYVELVQRRPNQAVFLKGWI